MRRTWGLMLWLAAGCTSPAAAVPDASLPCRPTLDTEQLLDPHVPPGLLNQELTLRFGLVLKSCDGRPVDTQVSATGQVLDPSNTAIDAKVDAGVGDQAFVPAGVIGELFEGDLTFTPRVLGPHHVTLRFEPDDGTLQLDVQVGVDRRPAKYEPLPTPRCDDLAMSPGYELCLEQRTLYLLDAGVTLGTLDAVAFGVSGGYLWSVDEPASGPVLTLERLSPAMPPQPLGTLPLSGVPVGQTANLILGTVLASGPRALVVAPPYLQEIWFDGQFHLEPAWTLPMTLPLAVQWAPDAGAVVSGTVGFDGGAADGLCVVQFSSGYQCQPGTVLGFDGQRVWTSVGSALSAWQIAADGGVSQVSAPVSGLALQSVVANGKVFGPAVHDVWPFGVELFELGPEPRLAVYGVSTFESSTPATWGFSADGYWEWYGDGQLVFLKR